MFLPPRRFRLWIQILVSSGLVVSLTLVATLFLVSRRFESAALSQAAAGLERAARAIDLLAEARFDRRRAALEEWALAGQQSAIDAPQPAAEQRHSVDALGLAFVALLYEDGRAEIASRWAPRLSAEALARAHPLTDARRGKAARGLWNLDGRFFEVLAIPLGRQAPDGTSSVLVAGEDVGDVVEQVHAITGAEVLLLAGDRLVESTLTADRVPAVLERLVATPAAAASNIISIGAERYVVGSHDVASDLGGGSCRHVILQPVGEALAASRNAHSDILLVGLGIWVFVFAATVLGARSVTRPLTRLSAQLTDMAKRGFVRSDFPTCGGSLEIAQLESTFRLLANGLLAAEDDRERSYREAVGAIVAALDARDHGIYGHSRRVAGYAALLAERAGLPDSQRASLEWGALLHDIGKIAIPDAILQKRGPLDEGEWQIMRRHPEWGGRIVSQVAFLRPALSVVECHHESWDGSGYPGGRAGEEIPVEARIFTIVDAYDAITSTRPYRRGRSHEDAVMELDRVAGAQLDPLLVDVFRSIPVEELTTLRHAIDHQLVGDSAAERSTFLATGAE